MVISLEGIHVTSYKTNLQVILLETALLVSFLHGAVLEIQYNVPLLLI